MRGDAAQKACVKGSAEKGDPQRQRNSGNGAVVEMGRRGDAAQKACVRSSAEIGDPQWQRITGNGAVVERVVARGEGGRG